jgi:hypothetical protein
MSSHLHILTYSMQQSPSWEANWFSASQEIPRVLWNPKVHYRIHKCPPPVPILSQFDPVHTSTTHFRISILMLSSYYVWGSQVVSFPQVSPPETCICPSSPHTRYMPGHLILLDFITRTIVGEQYRSLSSSLCSFSHSLVTSSLSSG